MKKVTCKIKMEHAKILGGSYKNFEGRKDEYNRTGKRSFYVEIEDENFANVLKEDGWNVKPLKQRDESEPLTYKLQVFVSYEKYEPEITLISGQKETTLKEDTVACLDHAWLKDVELVISPYNWEINGKTGVKAYLQKMTATAVEDEYYRAYEE